MEGPVAVAAAFLKLLKAGRFEEAWLLADPEWQLGRLQAWLWSMRAHPAFAGADLDEESASGISGTSPRWWPDFAQIEASFWARKVSGFGFDSSRWGARSRPRPVELDYELVILEPGEHFLLDAGPEPDDSLKVLLHLLDGHWLVAAINSPRYRPGWPLTFTDGSPGV